MRVRPARGADVLRRCIPCYRPVPNAAKRATATAVLRTDRRPTPPLKPPGPLGPPHSSTTSPVPFRGRAPRRHTEVAVPMRHAEGARGE